MRKTSLAVGFALLAGVLTLAGLGLGDEPLTKGVVHGGWYSVVFKVETEGNSEVLNDVITTLRERIDPQGLMGLQWRPVGTDRIEVRMPLGSDQVRQARNAYLAAMEKLDERNITPAFLRRVVSAAPAERAKLIEDKTGLDSERGRLLKTACEWNDKMSAEYAKIEPRLKQLQAELAEVRKAPSTPEDQIQAVQNKTDLLRNDYDLTRGSYLTASAKLQDTNIRTRELSSILSLYLPSLAAKEMPEGMLKERRRQLDLLLKEFIEKRPDAAGDIDAVVDTYKKWAEVRGRLDDPQDLVRLVRQAGVLEFRIAPRRGAGITEEETQRYLHDLMDEGPQASKNRKDRFQWFKVRDPNERFSPDVIVGTWGGQAYVLLSDEAGATMLRSKGKGGWKVKARAGVDERGRPDVIFTLLNSGPMLFGDLTGSHIKEPMAILLDDEVYSAPSIQSRITNEGIITGTFTHKETIELAHTLNAGALQARVNPEPVSVQAIGASFEFEGADVGPGSLAIIRFNDDALLDGQLPTVERVATRFKVTAKELGGRYDKLAGQNTRVIGGQTAVSVDDFINTYDARSNGGNADGKVSLDEWLRQRRNEKVFGMLGGSKDQPLTREALQTSLPEFRYAIFAGEPNYMVVAELVDRAFPGVLHKRSSLKDKYVLLRDQSIPELDIPIGPEGYHEITRADADSATFGGTWHDQIADNIGGAMLALTITDPAYAMTPPELQERLRSTRLQAGRGDINVVQTAIIPLQPVPNTNNYASFVIIQRTEDIAPGPQYAENRRKFASDELLFLKESLDREESLEFLITFGPAVNAGATQAGVASAAEGGYGEPAMWLMILMAGGLATVLLLMTGLVIRKKRRKAANAAQR
jgi:hypothetical protein